MTWTKKLVLSSANHILDMLVFCQIDKVHYGRRWIVCLNPSKKLLQPVATVGNKKLPQLPQARGGMSGQEQQERLRVIEKQ